MEMQMESIPLQENNMRPRDDRVLSAELHNSPILAPLKVGILKSFWGINVNLQQIDNNTDQLNPYFSYYSEQCHLMLGDGGRHAAARTHCDISNIIQQFKQQTSREKIIDAVLSDSQLLKLPEGEHMIQGSINLAARLYLMMSFGVIPNAFTPARPLYWTTGSAQDFLAEQLGPTRVLGSQAVKFPKLFNGRNIERLGGIRIEWTSDLDQHLRIIHDEEGVAIFHHAAFLRLHQERYVKTPRKNPTFTSLKITGTVSTTATYSRKDSSTRRSKPSRFSSPNHPNQSRNGYKAYQSQSTSPSVCAALSEPTQEELKTSNTGMTDLWC